MTRLRPKVEALLPKIAEAIISIEISPWNDGKGAQSPAQREPQTTRKGHRRTGPHHPGGCNSIASFESQRVVLYSLNGLQSESEL
jgi:hypothetical protein